jgi:hypothetical protein
VSSTLRLAAVAALISVTGCLAKAAWIPNDHGGYTLMTRARSMDQALTRFRRTADDVCGDSRYSLSTLARKFGDVSGGRG